MRTKKTLSRLEQIYGPPKQNNLSLGDVDTDCNALKSDRTLN